MNTDVGIDACADANVRVVTGASTGADGPFGSIGNDIVCVGACACISIEGRLVCEFGDCDPESVRSMKTEPPLTLDAANVCFAFSDSNEEIIVLMIGCGVVFPAPASTDCWCAGAMNCGPENGNWGNVFRVGDEDGTW